MEVFRDYYTSTLLYILLNVAFILSAANGGKQCEVIKAGYAPGLSGMPTINKTSCLVGELLEDSTLSNALDCARSCRAGQKPKTCYYKFVIERYPINGTACELCTPNITNTLCPNCQCIIGDGISRMAITVNRMMPGPSIQVCLGDYIVVDVVNEVSGAGLTIHWHGLFQEDTQYYDGVPMLTQCPIPYSTSFRYQFYANNGGTHFWHAHTGLHKMDGVFGSLIVREPAKNEPNVKLYDFDLANHVIVTNDWMIEEATERAPGRTAGIVSQIADSILINGKGTYTDSNGNTTKTPLEVITVDANKRYRFRMVNAFCTVCGGELSIQGHNLTIIAMDGKPVKPVVVDSIVSFAGERYDFVINTNQTPGAYWIQVRGQISCAANQIMALALLQYTNASTTPATAAPNYSDVSPDRVIMNPLDGNCSRTDQYCVSNLKNARQVDTAILSEKPDLKLFLPIGAFTFNENDVFKPNTYNKFIVPFPGIHVTELINNITFQFPPSPPLSQLDDIPEDQFCNGNNLPKDCNSTLCHCTHLVEIPLDAVVELVILDSFRVPDIKHPFHLHGYAFNVISMAQPLGPANNTNNFMTVDYLKQLDENEQIERNFESPPGRDTISVPNNGYVIIRFHATNPGFWLFHCHILYHQLNGMEMAFRVGDKKDLPPKPSNFPTCGNFQPDINAKNRRKRCSLRRK
ncbi:uncharacterized protein LOC116431677 [Nomia melanderi]|uniref:uncharacterized protein LOC116431677 n=1 Tax=Nomia melanderi TaxID=2448451 RepID=UPI003FCD2443